MSWSPKRRAAKEYDVKQVLLAGGVAANRGLRVALEKEFAQHEGITLVIPPLALCTDNLCDDSSLLVQLLLKKEFAVRMI